MSILKPLPGVMPALFLGHGSPMNALADNVYTRIWSALGASIPRPRAILCISAHWYVEGTALTISTAPRTIHDFGGSRATCTWCSMRRREIPRSPGVCSNYSRLCRQLWTKAGVSTMERGPC